MLLCTSGCISEYAWPLSTGLYLSNSKGTLWKGMHLNFWFFHLSQTQLKGGKYSHSMHCNESFITQNSLTGHVCKSCTAPLFSALLRGHIPWSYLVFWRKQPWKSSVYSQWLFFIFNSKGLLSGRQRLSSVGPLWTTVERTGEAAVFDLFPLYLFTRPLTYCPAWHSFFIWLVDSVLLSTLLTFSLFCFVTNRVFKIWSTVLTCLNIILLIAHERWLGQEQIWTRNHLFFLPAKRATRNQLPTNKPTSYP